MGKVFVVSLHSMWELLWDKAETFWGPRIKQGFLCSFGDIIRGYCCFLWNWGFGSHLRALFTLYWLVSYVLICILTNFVNCDDLLLLEPDFSVDLGTIWLVFAWNGLIWFLLKSDYRNRIVSVSFDEYGLKLHWIRMPIRSSNLCNCIWCRHWSWTVL